MKPRSLFCLLLTLAILPDVAGGRTGDQQPVDPAAADDELSSAAETRRRWVIFPADDLYPRYLANPDAPATGVTVQLFSTTAIEQASDRRQHVKIGGVFPLLRWRERQAGGRRWQLRLDGGLDAQFDPENRTDNTGWDGNYGLMVTSDRETGGLALRFGVFHISSHLGDEWIERTGRRRVGYRREELVAGAAREWGRGRRVYLEAGWAYDMLSALQERGRLEAGVEYEGSAGWLSASTGWYAALDLSAWEERDWRLDTGAQVGIVARPHRRTWRFGVQYWDGRVPLGEFFAATEAYLALGLWTEL